MILGFGICQKSISSQSYYALEICKLKQEMELSKQEMVLSGPSSEIATDL